MHKTSRKLGGDWITVKQSKTFENTVFYTIDSGESEKNPRIFSVKDDIFPKHNCFYAINVRVLTPPLEYSSYMDTSLRYKDSSWNTLGIEPYNSPTEINYYISGFSGYYWNYISNYRYSEISFVTFPQTDIYLFINHVSEPIDITVTTTVKYLNFDS